MSEPVSLAGVRCSDADRERIAQAARDLGSDETQRALADVEQQALDVCQTPLVV